MEEKTKIEFYKRFDEFIELNRNKMEAKDFVYMCLRQGSYLAFCIAPSSDDSYDLINHAIEEGKEMSNSAKRLLKLGYRVDE